MNHRIQGGALAALALFATTATAGAQSLESRVYAKPNATVRLSYASRPGVCGGTNGNISMSDDRDKDGWESDCEKGPVMVTLILSGGSVTRITTRVGGRWTTKDGVTDLGTVPAAQAAQLMLTIARKGSKAADDAILPAMLADSVTIWPQLISLAKDEKLNEDVRKSAVFWVGQAAASAATAGLVEVVGDDALNRDVRESAVFALSQRPNDEGIPALLAIAKKDKDPKVRKSAMFWL